MTYLLRKLKHIIEQKITNTAYDYAQIPWVRRIMGTLNLFSSSTHDSGVRFSPGGMAYWLFAFFFGFLIIRGYYFDNTTERIEEEASLSVNQNLSHRPEKAIKEPKHSPLKEKLIYKIEQIETYEDLRLLDDFIIMEPGLIDYIPSAMPLLRKESVLSSPYGMRFHPKFKVWKKHAGLDLAAETNMPIFVTASGTVTTVDFNPNHYGNRIIVDHGNGFQTLYGHLEAAYVKEGEKVNAHDFIGLVGSTGISTGPHLHYEVIKNGKKLNPAPFFNYKYELYQLINP